MTTDPRAVRNRYRSAFLALIAACALTYLVCWLRVGADEYSSGGSFARNLLALIHAAGPTLLLTCIAFPCAVAGGLLLAALRGSNNLALSTPAAGYIELIRGTPLLVQLFLVFYTLPELGLALKGTWLLDVLGQDFFVWDRWTTAIVCLSANYAAYEAEVLRAGLEAVPRGQREAALAIGLSEWQAFFLIVLPQAFRIVIPPLTNDVIAMLKDTCLVHTIGLMQLLSRAEAIGKTQANRPSMLFTAALIYLVLSLLFYLAGKWLELTLQPRGASTPAPTPALAPHGH